MIRVPMFPGYLFLRHAIDKSSYIEILQTKGMAWIIGEVWDRAAIIPDDEIEVMRRLLHAEVPVVAYPYLQQGPRVRIVAGPLANVEGILVPAKSNKGLLVLSVNLLQRSVAIEVDCSLVVPTTTRIWGDSATVALADR